MCNSTDDQQQTEGATQQEDVSKSDELIQQQLEQTNETIATLTEQLGRVQQTSQ